jgi:hypothetical protein
MLPHEHRPLANGEYNDTPVTDDGMPGWRVLSRQKVLRLPVKRYSRSDLYAVAWRDSLSGVRAVLVKNALS